MEVNRESIFAKIQYFVDVQLWLTSMDINPEGWLSNFDEYELDYAYTLLDSFIYINNRMTRQLFYSSFQDLGRFVVSNKSNPNESLKEWTSFCKELIVTHVTGENPSTTDSGHIFARMARQVLGIEESRILSQETAIRKLLVGDARSLVFVDDFVGSGDQILETWYRPIDIASGISFSFADIEANYADYNFFYCPLVCAATGRRVVKQKVPNLVINAPYFLSERYNILDMNSIIWPPNMAKSGIDFVYSASKRAGIPDSKMSGYATGGLGLAFEHGVPDATLPIFYWEENDWHPLIKRR